MTAQNRFRRTTVLLIVLAMLVGINPMRFYEADAVYNVNPPSAPGFPVSLNGGGAIYEGSPTLADVNGDGKLEIFIGGPDASDSCKGRLYGISSNGTPMWNIQTRAPIDSTPAVADVNGDGVPEVVVGLGTVESASCANGGLLAVNARTGAVKWIFNTQDWLGHSPDGKTDPVFSSPAIADFFGDGRKEIVFGAWDQCIYMLDGSGQPVWPNLPSNQSHCGGHGFYNEDTVWSSPAVADLNGDGKPEIIIGADITAGNRNNDPTGGYVYVLDAQGNQLARHWLDQAIFSSPAIGDIDGDGRLEIVVGTGVWVHNTGYYVTAWNFAPGAPITDALVQKHRWTTSGRVFSSPALADLNHNGGLDVIAISSVGEGPWTGGPDNGSKVFAWDGKTGVKLFETMICDAFGNRSTTHASPVAADIDGDGELEILFSHIWEVGILNHDGTYYTDYSSSGSQNAECTRSAIGTPPTTNLTFFTGYYTYGTPAVGDLTGDGKLEIVVGTGTGPNPSLNVGRVFAWRPTATGNKVPWPMFRQNPQHTGMSARGPALAVSPGSLMFFYGNGVSILQRTVTLRNDGDTPFNWSAGISNANCGASISGASSGTVSTSAQVTVRVNSSSVGSTFVTTQCGTLTISGTVTGGSVAGSPQSVPLSRLVGPFKRLHLPIILR